MNNDHTTGPVRNLGTDTRHGTHLTFWLDRDYLGDDAKLPTIDADITGQLLAQTGRPEVRLTVLDRRGDNAAANRPS